MFSESPMISPDFLVFELLMYLLFGLCLTDAARRGGNRVVELCTALVYGITLEWMTLQQLNAYVYGKFFLMLAGAPLCIGAGWAIIIYSAMEFSERLSVSDRARPFIDGFLALNIDFAMDAVAIRQKFWTWGIIELDQEWFGVPWGNFWAWFIVVTSFSFFARRLRKKWERSRHLGYWTYPLISLVLSLAVLASSNLLMSRVLYETNMQLFGLLALLGWGTVEVARGRPKLGTIVCPNLPSILVPLAMHIYFTVTGFYFGFYQQIPLIGAVGISMLALSLWLHLTPWARGRAGRGKATEL